MKAGDTEKAVRDIWMETLWDATNMPSPYNRALCIEGVMDEVSTGALDNMTISIQRFMMQEHDIECPILYKSRMYIMVQWYTVQSPTHLCI